MTKMMEKVKEVETQIKAVDATKTKKKVKEVDIQMKTLESGMTKTNERVEGVDGQLNVFYKELKENSIYIVDCVFASGICIIFGGHTLLASRSNPKNKTTGPAHGTGAQRSDFCLIQSFNELEDVEPHKFAFIFVDFNDRNIILENEHAEFGDLRNQTTRVLISLRCDVFMVYCKDKGSWDLPSNSLYNTRLKSMEKHELSTLSRKKRVMSIDDRFHSNQVEHLKENVIKNFNASLELFKINLD